MLRWVRRKLFVVNQQTGRFEVDHEKRVLQMLVLTNWVDVPTVDEYTWQEQGKVHSFVGSKSEIKKLKSERQTRKHSKVVVPAETEAMQ